MFIFYFFYFFFFFFFFSSRRRHTRLTCDWSSDVCSSDLNYFRLPSTNRKFWQNKIDGNRSRDIRYRKQLLADGWRDRKSTRLNSSHMSISYAVFCLKKKNIVKHIRMLLLLITFFNASNSI